MYKLIQDLCIGFESMSGSPHSCLSGKVASEVKQVHICVSVLYLYVCIHLL